MGSRQGDRRARQTGGREPGEALVGLDLAVRACRERDGTTQGVPTYLLLEDSEAPASQAAEHHAAHDTALGGLAEAILARLVGPGVRPSERDVALALEVLAARRFAPYVSDPAVSRTGGERSPLAAAFAAGRYVRAVNFHATPPRLAGRLEEQLSWLAEQRFVPLTYDDLLRLVSGGGWPHDKPGVVVSFYNGFRDSFEVAAPILERAGLVGWFFVVAGWVATPLPEQRGFADAHRIVLPPDEDLPADGRLALSPDEVAGLAGRGHVVASHTLTHSSPAPGLSREELEREAAGSMRELERMLGGRPVRALAWHGGTSLGVDARADEALRSAGYELLFANHAIQRAR